MIKVAAGFDQRLGEQPVDRCLDRLPGQAHPPRDLGHRERPPGQCHGSQHLPARRCEPLPRREPAAGGEQQPVDAEGLQDDLCCRVPFGGPGLLNDHDKSLSY